MIQILNLRKEFRIRQKKIVALNSLNLEIKTGEIFGLLGTNGAGKTTTIKLLSTLLAPSAGTATINGLDIRKDAKKIRKIIGVVFSQKMIYYRLTGRANLEFYGNIYNVPDLKNRIAELAAYFDLDNRLDDLVESYSTGMKAKLSVIRGLIHNPSIIFLDEPTLGLDPIATVKLREQIKNLAQEGKTIIFTSHNMADVEALCDRIGILKDGGLIALDTPQEIRRLIPGIRMLEIKLHDPNQLNQISPQFKSTKKGRNINIPIKDRDELNHVLNTITSEKIIFEDIILHQPSLEKAFAYLTREKDEIKTNSRQN